LRLACQLSAFIVDSVHQAATPVTESIANPITHLFSFDSFLLDSKFIFILSSSFVAFPNMNGVIVGFGASINLARSTSDLFFIFSFDSAIIILYLFSALLLSLFIFATVTFFPPLTAL